MIYYSSVKGKPGNTKWQQLFFTTVIEAARKTNKARKRDGSHQMTYLEPKY